VEYSNFLTKACSLAVETGGAAILRALYGQGLAGSSKGPGRVSAPIPRGFGHGALGGEALTGGIGSTMAAAMILLVNQRAEQTV
jgi:hypothetical protein